jgi:hypothetical protein
MIQINAQGQRVGLHSMTARRTGMDLQRALEDELDRRKSGTARQLAEAIGHDTKATMKALRRMAERRVVVASGDPKVYSLTGRDLTATKQEPEVRRRTGPPPRLPTLGQLLFGRMLRSAR